MVQILEDQNKIRQYRGKSTEMQSMHFRFDPVTTDPKGEIP